MSAILFEHDSASDRFDDGLAHNHGWASDLRSAARTGRRYPVVADAAAVPTPSCVRHDDAHHSA